MPILVAAVLLFTTVGVGFILVNLTLGRLLRPSSTNVEKATIYECGEPPIGSAYIQFDLRFYVVALLFVIFDVEMAFFFPWAVVFGQTLNAVDATPATEVAAQHGLRELSLVAFADILFFFGFLLVGFAYLWKRGDLDWVRSVAGQGTAAADAAPSPRPNVAVRAEPALATPTHA